MYLNRTSRNCKSRCRKPSFYSLCNRKWDSPQETYFVHFKDDQNEIMKAAFWRKKKIFFSLWWLETVLLLLLTLEKSLVQDTQQCREHKKRKLNFCLVQLEAKLSSCSACPLDFLFDEVSSRQPNTEARLTRIFSSFHPLDYFCQIQNIKNLFERRVLCLASVLHSEQKYFASIHHATSLLDFSQ